MLIRTDPKKMIMKKVQSLGKEDEEIDEFDYFNKSSLREDGCCPICREFCAQPTRLKCGHHICLICLKHIIGLEIGKNCPICRSDLENLKPRLDNRMQDLIEKYDTVTYNRRKKELIENANWISRFGGVMKLEFGSIHQEAI